MWKVLIADDEPKIRQGLRRTLETFGLPLSVCAETKNGLEALDKAKECRPDILLVDICMPRLSGIQFLEEIRKLSLDCKMLVISGFNEFSYAKQAMNLGVSDYLLKPIEEEELKTAVEKLIEELEQSRKSRRFMEMFQQQIMQNRIQLREVFFNDWVEGNLGEKETVEQMELLDIRIPSNVVIVLISVHAGYVGEGAGSSVGEAVHRMTLEEIVRSLLEKYAPVYLFGNRYQDAVALMPGYRAGVETLHQYLQEEMERQAGGRCCVQIKICQRDEVPQIYKSMCSNARKVMECRPIVLEARKYIYAHYGERDLDLTQVAYAIGCNASYLSRIMKQELGISFKDFLTMLRISRAIYLMRNNQLSLNQIAELVGYSNQHYFSAAFKNCQGVSPSEFRRNLVQD